MNVYHGSNVAVESSQLLKTQRDLDFGKGFYTTSDYGQAAAWARRTTRIRKRGEPIVSCYRLNDPDLQGIKVLRFQQADLAWLKHVAANRKGQAPAEDWDLVIGPVANDQTFPTLLLYLDGYLDAQSTIRQLLPQRLKDQYVFKTSTALSLLTCMEVRQA